jgi:hypothetical protein
MKREAAEPAGLNESPDKPDLPPYDQHPQQESLLKRLCSTSDNGEVVGERNPSNDSAHTSDYDSHERAEELPASERNAGPFLGISLSLHESTP